MTLSEMIEMRKQLRKQNDEIRQAADAEKRSLTAEELEHLSKNATEMSRLNDDILMAENELRSGKQEPAKRSSIRKTILNARDSRSREFTIGEKRAAITTANGSGVIENHVFDIMAAVRDNMAITQAGARFLTNLTGDLKLPSLSGATAAWEGENDEAIDGGAAINTVTLQPKRLACYVDLSNKLLEQDSQDIDALIEQDMIRAISEAIQKAILGAGAAGEAPAGIFNGKTVAKVVDYTDFVDLETAVAKKNFANDNCSYILAPGAMGLAKTTAKGDGLAMIYENGGTINGYKAIRTNGAYATSTDFGVAFGDFSELFIGSFGSIKVTVDPYTQATKGMTRLVVNAYVDAKLRSADAVAVKVIKAPVA